MKKSHILGILVIAVAVFIIISVAGDASTYVTFSEAMDLTKSGNSKEVHVVGKLYKDSNGEIKGIEPSEDKLAVSFLMVDNNNKVQKVYYNEPMPPDLKMSEQVVVVGKYKDDTFYASQILLKCPSKYEDETINVSQAN